MERIYIEYDMARFTRKNLTLMDVELYDGRKFENLEPRRLFPTSGLEKYITLLDESGVEQAIIRDLRTLPKEERAVIEDCLREYYLIPQIQQVVSCEERRDNIILHTVTDRGAVDIELQVYNRNSLKFVQDYRALLRDVNDNRYEIPDVTLLDKHSQHILSRYL